MRWLEGKTKVVLDGVQGEECVLAHDDLTKGPLLGFTDDTGKEKVDLRLKLLKKPRYDGEVVFLEPSIQRQNIFNFS